jgi:hypothetical protein
LPEDRKSIDALAAENITRDILPKLNLPPDHANELLAEIIERSGLLLSIDRGERVQFVHQNLQEFYVAKHFLRDEDELLRRLDADRDAYREVITLWCGLGVDASGVIRHLLHRDAELALECLGEAQNVDPALAGDVLAEFQRALAEGRIGRGALQAYAIVASDPRRPRSRQAFDYLCGVLKNVDARQARVAAEILAMTNLPQAAAALAESYPERRVVRTYLRRMGDLAVGHLQALSLRNSASAADDLARIGTPSAWESLVRLLWSSNELAAERAAWRLAHVLGRPVVDDALSRVDTKAIGLPGAGWEWVWDPFTDHRNIALPRIVAKVASLLGTRTWRRCEIDPRVAVPMGIAMAPVDLLKSVGAEPVRPTGSYHARDQHRLQEWSKTALEVCSRRPSQWGRLMRALPAYQRYYLLTLLRAEPRPTASHWQRLNGGGTSTYDYEFKTSLHLELSKVLIVLLCVLWSSVATFALLAGITGSRINVNSSIGVWFAFGAMIAAYTSFALGLRPYRPRRGYRWWVLGLLFAPVVPVATLVYANESTAAMRSEAASLLICTGSGLLWTSIALGVARSVIWHSIGLGLDCSIMAVVIVAAGVMARGMSLEHNARNPLRGILDRPEFCAATK